MGIKAGVCTVNITPPIGFPMAGYSGRDRGCETVDDELFAKALVLDDGETKLAIVTTDLVGIPSDFAGEIKSIVRRKTDIPEGNVIICASHTHFGPALRRLNYLPEEAQEEFHESYVQNAVRLIAGAIRVADGSLRDAKLGWGRGEAPQLVFNRRTKRPDGKVVMSWRPPKPEEARELTFGPTDPDVGVIRIDDAEGKPIATVINFACHPVCGVDRLYAISADYPGYAMRAVEKVRGGTCMFSLGCAGNIVPIEREGDARRWIGTALGAEVLKVAEGIETDSNVKLGVKSNSVKLPLKPLPSPDELRREIEETERAIAEAERKGAPYPEISALKGKLQKAKHTLLLAEETGGERAVETEIKAVRLGTLKLACLPGEVFVEIGLSIKEKHKDAFAISLCNDSLNYVPISSAYDEGGYEPETTTLERGAGEKLLSEILKLLEEV
ncbi:neutral/alkaline non-lysosomal ceramidase N-terminal domain-containing protein [Candidatus Poribacteria bacterium]|nr:neutral/alkaline non-lysosomal ceramidase N-terminal domain-containing protein [Candidatus Poribacteria bacterium]